MDVCEEEDPERGGHFGGVVKGSQRFWLLFIEQKL